MKDFLLEALYKQGKNDALALRSEAFELTGTEIIDREISIPAFDSTKDYSQWPIGAPVTDEGQVWILLQPHNASHYNSHPNELRALWGLCHTTNPSKAKPWVEPYGTSGMYMINECYVDNDGVIWRSLKNNLVYDAVELPTAWERV